MKALEKARKWDFTPMQITSLGFLVLLVIRLFFGDRAADRAIADAKAVMGPVARMAADFGYAETNSP